MVLYGAGNLTNRKQAYDLLAFAAYEHWNLTPLPPISRETHGKPYFSGMGNRRFNLSHSGTFALCALDSRPVGVDIQIVKPHRAGLPRRVCSDRELAWLGNDKPDWDRFTQLWALKECLVKYTGEGLTRPIAELSIPLPNSPGVPLVFGGLWFQLYSGPGWQAAVCGEAKPPAQIHWISL